jgi:hypothetical protein
MVGIGLLLSFFFVPSIAQPHQTTEKPSLKLWGKSQVEMLKVFTLLIYPNVFFAVRLLLVYLLIPTALTDTLHRISPAVSSPGPNTPSSPHPAT